MLKHPKAQIKRHKKTQPNTPASPWRYNRPESQNAGYNLPTEMAGAMESLNGPENYRRPGRGYSRGNHFLPALESWLKQ
jgi:hypothetical protein